MIDMTNMTPLQQRREVMRQIFACMRKGDKVKEAILRNVYRELVAMKEPVHSVPRIPSSPINRIQL